jgi:hypothetical protein
MWGKADETEHLPGFDSGLAPPSSLISLNGKPKISHRVVRGEKHGWPIASQTLSQGKVKAASVCRRASIGVRTGVAEGAAKSAYLQSVST